MDNNGNNNDKSAHKGHIGVTTENIFPVIKKFLYSDHEIFLRELVSNAVDATQKLRTLSAFGDYKGTLDDLRVEVKIDKEAGTLTVSDHGIGMTAEEIDKYINQIAFSGAEEFLQKFKDSANAIIGHFGLGFYSAFMVADKVEIRTLSYKEGAEAVSWTCDGSPEYTMAPCDKTERGTDIILHIDADDQELLDKARIDGLLKKYCRFLPVSVVSGKKQEWKDGKMQDTEDDNVVNALEPAWTKKPADLTDEDYRTFYRELYPGQEDPLFWIHLNVDYPFTLTGILYFPRIKNQLDVRKDRIQLYCNQVYVTDSVEGVVPEFMMLLQGVIDSPDIPLNVSRSYLQSDTAVKKISGYITKKVADRLQSIFNTDREDFEKKWDDIRLFIEYGMLTDTKFGDAAMKFVLVRDSEGKYFTLDEYRTLIEPEQTDKDGTVVWLYTTDAMSQHSYIEDARSKGYSVLNMDGQLDSHFIGLLEQKMEKARFVRVDSDITDNLIPKADRKGAGLDTAHSDVLSQLWRLQVPQVDKAEFIVTFEAVGADANPIVITQHEYMRRMKDMAAIQPGMNFYGELPDSYNLIVNTESPVVKRIIDAADASLMPACEPHAKAIDEADAKLRSLEGKDDAQGERTHLEETMTHERKEREKAIRAWGDNYPLVRQTIDLALLANGLLRGAHLSEFIKRSAKLL